MLHQNKAIKHMQILHRIQHIHPLASEEEIRMVDIAIILKERLVSVFTLLNAFHVCRHTFGLTNINYKQNIQEKYFYIFQCAI